MKAKLEFDLPEEREEFETAQKAGSYALVLHQIDQFLRSKIKYAPDEQTEEVTQLFQSVRDKLYELADEYGVEI